MSKHTNIRVYTDGSGTTKDKPGGWGYVIVVDGEMYAENSGHIPKATNNVAELTAAVEGLNAAELLKSVFDDPEITLVSDSKLVLGYASGEYRIKAMHLVPLFTKLRQLYKRLDLQCEWVKGHSGNEFNERCDVLAKTARLEGDIGTKEA